MYKNAAMTSAGDVSSPSRWEQICLQCTAYCNEFW